MSASRSSPGFTLLEVLVAVAILGLGLTMILSSQVGLFSSAARSEHLTVATNLARCKMAEVELELVKEGYPVIDQTDEGPCCADETEDGYRCAVKIERVVLPQPTDLPAGDGGTEDEGATGGPFEALAKLQTGQLTPQGEGPASLQGLAQSIGSSASASGMAPMVMNMVYPDLKPMLEASIRKVTVKVLWREGKRDREFAVTQFVTDPQQGGLDGDAGLVDGGIPNMPNLGGLLPGMGQGTTGTGTRP